MGDDFLKLKEEELASFELRPMRLEEKYIKEFSSDRKNNEKNALINNDDSTSCSEDIVLSNFFFTYTPEKYLFFKKKLSVENESICQLRVKNLVIKHGEIVGIIGKNGSGKSTFLRCLCGLEKTCIGRAYISNEEYRGKKLTRICYMVMQDVNH